MQCFFFFFFNFVTGGKVACGSRYAWLLIVMMMAWCGGGLVEGVRVGRFVI
jgi:hypothetical protein